MIFDLPSSHRSWKGRYFFVNGRNWEYDPLDKDDTLGVPVAWTPPENLVSVRFVFSITCLRSSSISDSVLSSCFPSARIDLSVEDNAIALALAKCSPHPYAEFIKSGCKTQEIPISIKRAQS